MWLCFNNAFVSVVADANSNLLMVRARRREHLQNLFNDEVPILIGTGTDYKYRVIVDRVTLCEVVQKVLTSLRYTSFKQSVTDQALHDLYSNFWSLHYGIQE